MSNISYSRVNWEDSPSTNTPINATNLNKMDKGIADCALAINNNNTQIATINSNLTADNKTFKADYQNSKYGFTVDGIFHPFSSGAVLIGEYSANATIDVSAYGATSANQFLLVPSAQDYITLSVSGATMGHAWYYMPTLILNGNSLTINLPTLAVALSNYGGFIGDNSNKITCKLYYVGDIES